MPRLKVSATIDKELIEWLDQQVENRRFRNRSHGLEVALAQFVEREKEKGNK